MPSLASVTWHSSERTLPAIHGAASIAAAASIDGDLDVYLASILASTPISAGSPFGSAEAPLGLAAVACLLIVLGHWGPRLRPCLMAE